MDFITTFLIAIALAMDAFSVCICAGMTIKKPDFGHYFRLSFHFGLFQFIMPIIGYFCGIYLDIYIKTYDHWIAFILLAFIGLKMIKESFEKEKDQACQIDPSKGARLIVLAIATSIDALAVGLSFGVLGQPILFPSVIIGIVCASFSILGILIGEKVGIFAGKKAEAIGGSMLVLIGIKILFEHLYV